MKAMIFFFGLGLFSGLLHAQESIPYEVVAEVPVAPGNLTLDQQGRIYFSLHQHYGPNVRMGQLDPEDSTRVLPFPTLPIATDKAGESLAINSVLGVQTDRNGVVWMLDNTMREGGVPKLIGWHPDAGLKQVIYLPAPAIGEAPFLNDLAVDIERHTIYLADTSLDGSPALIVVDTKTGLARRVLEKHESVQAEQIPMLAGGEEVKIHLPDGNVINPKVAVNPIALDATGEYLYYGPMTGTGMYRISTDALRDRTISEEDLAAKVEKWADRPISDGISIDTAGNIYISAVATNEIGVIRAETKTYEPLIRGEEISWPDAFSFGPDGYMYAVINQLHKGPVLNAGTDGSEPPYRIIKFKPLAPGIIGR